MFRKKNVKKIVHELLSTDIRTRSDDNYLIGRVQELIIPGTSEMTLNQVLCLINVGCLPTFESIRRARQIQQREHPELKDKEVLPFRECERKVYLKFVRCAV